MAGTRRESHADTDHPVRTLGEIIEALSGRKSGLSPLLELEPLPADVLPDLALPEVELEHLSKGDL